MSFCEDFVSHAPSPRRIAFGPVFQPRGLIAVLSLMILGVTVSLARPAHASIVLSDAVAQADAYGPAGSAPNVVGTTTAFQTYTYGGNQPAELGGTASASADGTVRPTVFATSSGVTTATASLSYYMEIVGPSVTSVPVAVSGSLIDSIDSAALGASYGVAAYSNISMFNAYGTYLDIQDAASNQVLDPSQCATPDLSCQNNLAQLIELPVNEPILVTLGAVAYSNGVSDLATAEADLCSVIAPSFADADQYQIVFSADVGDTPLPEPRAFMAILPGLLILGWLWVRRRSEGIASVRNMACRPYSFSLPSGRPKTTSSWRFSPVIPAISFTRSSS